MFYFTVVIVNESETLWNLDLMAVVSSFAITERSDEICMQRYQSLSCNVVVKSTLRRTHCRTIRCGEFGDTFSVSHESNGDSHSTWRLTQPICRCYTAVAIRFNSWVFLPIVDLQLTYNTYTTNNGAGMVRQIWAFHGATLPVQAMRHTQWHQTCTTVQQPMVSPVQ